MATAEFNIVPAQTERISWFVKEAVKWVPLGDYLKLRNTVMKWRKDYDPERRQFSQVGWAVCEALPKEPGGKMFSSDSKIGKPANLQEKIARRILTDVSMPDYLVARREVLKRVEGRMGGEIALTEKAMKVAGISLA